MAPGARWPEHLLDQLRRWLTRDREGASQTAGETGSSERAAAWVALQDGLALFLRKHGRAYGATPEDIEDLASAKALELFSRCESGTWRVDGRSGGEFAAYLSTVARNAVVDLLRRRGRIVPEVSLNGGPDAAAPVAPAAAAADARVMAHEFISSLRACLEEVQPRARRVWFFRVFYGASSREIAQHSDIGLRVGNIDVIMQRTRDTIRRCMQQKGFQPDDMPAGTFVELWEAIESLSIESKVEIASREVS